jgi:hypothetical protein
VTGQGRGIVERFVMTAVALLAAAFMLRLAVTIVRPLLPFLGGLVVAAITLMVTARVLIRRRDGTW